MENNNSDKFSDEEEDEKSVAVIAMPYPGDIDIGVRPGAVDGWSLAVDSVASDVGLMEPGQDPCVVLSVTRSTAFELPVLLFA